MPNDLVISDSALFATTERGLLKSTIMKAIIVTRSLGIAAMFSCLAACAGSRTMELRAAPGAEALAIGEPAGGESAPIAGRVDLPPQQPRR